MEPYVGQLMLFAGNFAPLGWALCDGQLISIRQNTALFSVLGNYYGGDGKVTFALPDLRGRVASHTDTTDNNQIELGTAYGTESNVLTINQMPQHTHVTSGNIAPAANSNTDEDSESPIDSFLRSTSGVSTYAGAPTGVMGASPILATIGATGAKNPAVIPNIQPTLSFSYCIALEGIFPQRP